MRYWKKGKSMKTVEVVCGALVKDGRVLIARRVSNVSNGWYEFPGGKVEPGETAEEALRREWQEECGITLDSVELLAQGEDCQEDTPIHLHCFLITSHEQPQMRVHDSFVWTTPDHIYDWKFFESDRGLVKALEERLCGKQTK